MQIHPTHSEHGGVLAEFAIVLPLVLLMIVGALDLGRVWVIAAASANAAQSGAQYGAQSPTLSADVDGMRAATISDLQNSAMVKAALGDDDGVTMSDFTITPERYCECSGGASISCTSTCGGGVKPSIFVRVSVASTFETMFDYPGIPATIPIARVAVLRAR